MIWVLLFLPLLLLAAPLLAEALRKPVDTRAAPGAFAETPSGPTHIRWHGPPSGPVAVCIHGLTTPSFVFDALVGQLVANGFRVLTYDLPGRGFTPPQPGEQDADFFLSQLRGVLADQGIADIDLLVGYSMGGSIATTFAASDSDRVERLVLLAPAGLYHAPDLLARLIREVPGLGDWIMRSFGGVILRRGIEDTGDLAERQRAQTRKRGFLQAVLSSMRHMLTMHLGPAHEKIGALGIPVLAVWGEEDRVIPISNVGRLAQANRKAQQVTLPGADHRLPYTHAGEIAEAIRNFVKETA